MVDKGRGGKTTGNGRAWSRQVPEGSGEQGKVEKTGCKIICGAPTTLAVKGLMMMMMINHLYFCWVVIQKTMCSACVSYWSSSACRWPSKRPRGPSLWWRKPSRRSSRRWCRQRERPRPPDLYPYSFFRSSCLCLHPSLFVYGLVPMQAGYFSGHGQMSSLERY